MVRQNKSATFTSPNWTKYHRSPWKHLALLTSQVDIWNRWHLVASFLGKLQACQLKILNIIQVPSINFISTICLFHLHWKDSTFVKSFKKKSKPSEFPKGVSSHILPLESTGGSKIPGRCRHPGAHFCHREKFLTNPTASAAYLFGSLFAWKKNPMKKR